MIQYNQVKDRANDVPKEKKMKIKRLFETPKYRNIYVCETENGFFGFYVTPAKKITEKDLIPMPGYTAAGRAAEEMPDYILKFYGLEKEA